MIDSNGFENQIFQSVTFGQLSVNEVIKQIKIFLEDDPNAQYSLVIGTDSHEKSESSSAIRNINLVTAILIHRKGFGGRYFWRKTEKKNIHSLREKIYAETTTSLDFASSFMPLFRKGINGKMPRYNLEIHIDVGEHGDTRDMIKEVVGMVTGNGFVVKTKPYAYGASYVADKHA